MDISTAEFIRTLCPDFQWLDRQNKAEIKKAYQAELDQAKGMLVELNQAKIKVNQEITSWNDRWLLELNHEIIDDLIHDWQKQIRKYAWILKNFHRKPSNQGITDADIEAAKAVPIETLYEGQLREHTGHLLGLCPFHEEKTPSFTIYKTQNSWWCYGCSQGGSVVDYVMKLKECQFLDAVKFLINK